ncbi:thermonuclease family protein [Tepidiforma sp.]|uniref:thermonuclease family protein n=1 Tax=Tepidiforma sp. TaxID=2682230 RepID=UPI002ADDE085|nr:thermonuclease family protein [Tepidiforma sp.]
MMSNVGLRRVFAGLLAGMLLLAAGCSVYAGGGLPPGSGSLLQEQSGTSGQYRAYAPMLAADSAGPTGLVYCTVTAVVDGDTIDVGGCADAGRVRLILIDTPEIFGGARCFSREASDYTKQFLLGRTVGLERNVSNTDRYGRFLRYAWLDGELFNERIVRDGYAVLAEFPPDLKYRDRIAAAEAEARAANRGLWAACGGIDRPATPTPVGVASPTPTRTPSPTPSATPTPGGSCGAATARIVSLNKSTEVLVIEGSGNMSGWYVISERGNQRFDFPQGFVLSGRVEIVSDTPRFTNTATRLWWSDAAIWNNSLDDDALLYDCTGRLVQRFDDGD